MVRSAKSVWSIPIKVCVIIGQPEKEVLTQYLTEALQNHRLASRGKRPPDLTGFESIPLYDRRAVDGDRLDAWFKRDNGGKITEVYAELTHAGRAGPDTVGPFWYGPGTLPAVKS